MSLELMRVDSDTEPNVDERVIEAWRDYGPRVTIRIWCGDWCGDCQAQLPPFAAVLATAGIDPDSTLQYPVEKQDDGTKVGPRVEEYGIEYIPTIVLERDGEEFARYIEPESVDAATYLASALTELEV